MKIKIEFGRVEANCCAERDDIVSAAQEGEINCVTGKVEVFVGGD